MSPKTTVLITGGSGFLGSRCVLDALQRGYDVRTTVRGAKQKDAVQKMLLRGGATQAQVDSVAFVIANLTSDEGWDEACKGCTFVMHVASPNPPTMPKHEDDLIVPARGGTLRVLRAAQSAQTVKRVVLTSSVAAVIYGHPDRGTKPYSEEDWSQLDNPDSPVAPYPKSKTLAEKAAWEFMREGGGDGGMELTVVGPGGIFGPVLGTNNPGTVKMVERMVKGKLPGMPQLWVGLVDVRDVSDLHFRAMTDPKAAGERFLCLSPEGLVEVKEIAEGLKRRLGSVKGQKIPTRVVPNWLLRVVGMWDAEVGLLLPELGKHKYASSEKAQRVLGWKPRSAEDSILATAQSLEEIGILP